MLPQIIYLILATLSVCEAIKLHGKPKVENHNIIVYFVGLTIQILLLCFGGFFDCWIK